MIRSRLLVAAVAAMMVGLSGVALAELNGDAAIKERKSVMEAIGKHFKELNKLAKDATGHEKEISDHAKAIAELSGKSWAYFPAGSEKGVKVETEAKPEIWAKPEIFKASAQKFETEAAKLAELAAGTDMDAMRKQIAAVGGTCKSCHEDFKTK